MTPAERADLVRAMAEYDREIAELEELTSGWQNDRGVEASQQGRLGLVKQLSDEIERRLKRPDKVVGWVSAHLILPSPPTGRRLRANLAAH